MTRTWWGTAAAFGLVGLVAIEAGAQTGSVTVSLSDPSRVGTLAVQVMAGSVRITGGDRRDVSVGVQSAREQGVRGSARSAPPAGLRRLDAPVGFSIEEAKNVIRLSASPTGERGEFALQVPSRMNLRISILNGGLLSVDGVEGDIEVDNLNGGIQLTNVAGSVVANSNNGDVVASLLRVAESKAMAFTSLNGKVDVTLPASVRASLSMRTNHGDVYTDFELQSASSDPPVVRDTRPTGGRYRIDVSRTIRGTINGGGPDFELRTLNGDVFLRRGK